MIFSLLNLGLIGSSTYFYIKTSNNESDYLNETNPALIESRYEDYNNSYKIRNALLISYAIFWVYSQIDLLFFSDDHISLKVNSEILSSSRLVHQSYQLLSFSLNF